MCFIKHLQIRISMTICVVLLQLSICHIVVIAIMNKLGSRRMQNKKELRTIFYLPSEVDIESARVYENFSHAG